MNGAATLLLRGSKLISSWIRRVFALSQSASLLRLILLFRTIRGIEIVFLQMLCSAFTLYSNLSFRALYLSAICKCSNIPTEQSTIRVSRNNRMSASSRYLFLLEVILSQSEQPMKVTKMWLLTKYHSRHFKIHSDSFKYKKNGAS